MELLLLLVDDDLGGKDVKIPGGVECIIWHGIAGRFDV
jgi:hypothetical protein